MFLLEITNEQIIITLASVITIVSASGVKVAKMGWDWLKGQFDYLTSRIEKLEAKMDEERNRLELKLDQERDEQDKRIDGLFEKVLSKMKTEKIDISKLDLKEKK